MRPPSWRPAAIVALIALALTAGSCGSTGSGEDPTSGEAGAALSVVASFYPLAEAAGTIGGEHVRVTNLTPPGVEPHDLELSPDQVEALTTADLVLYLGGGFQPAVEEAVGVTAEGTVVDVLDALPDPGADPHVWMSPVLMQRIADRVLEVLSELAPANAAAFDANASRYADDLASLEHAFREGLADCERDIVVTSHAAFGHLAAEYGLVQLSVSGLSPEAEPDARTLAELAERIRQDGTTTVYYETLVSPKLAQTLADETGVQTAVLNPIEGLTEEQSDAGEDYASLMRENLEALRSGLDCA